METTGHLSNGGLSLFYRGWSTSRDPRAVVAIIPGFNSHSGYYSWVGERLAARGLATYAVDLRGRGRSDGERFYVADFDDYVSDAGALVAHARSHHPGLPLFILGHSAGGVVACLYAAGHQDALAGLISESFAFKVPAPDFALAVFKGLAHVAPHAHILHLKNEEFSRDPAAVKRMNDDPLIAHETQPSQTLAAMVRADEKLEHLFPSMTLPTLILHGTGDKAASAKGGEQFYAQSGASDKTLKLYQGAYHDLLNDTGREQVMADIEGWLDGHIAAR